MQVRVKGSNVAVSDSLRGYAEEKLGRLDRHLRGTPSVLPTRRRRPSSRPGEFPVKRMTADEAMLQIELVGHDFVMLRNVDTDDVNVAHRRRDGDYGPIEPTIA